MNSPDGSTTPTPCATPMTPMTPLTTPLHLMSSDVESHSASLELREDAARNSLEVIGKFLDHANSFLNDLEHREHDGNQVLGPAIIRVCNDLADGVAELARELELDEDDRRRMARACLEDANLRLMSIDEMEEEDAGSSASESTDDADGRKIARGRTATAEAARAMSNLSEEEIMTAVSTAQTILIDVEVALRSVNQDEAEEIGEVALVVARMFVWSLQSIHGTVTPQLLAGTEEERRMMDGARSGSEGSAIEVLDGEEKKDSERFSPGTARTTVTSRPHDNGRIRVLWPPLGPAVASAGKWGADSALKNPLLSIALGMALWPAGLITAFFGAPIVAADWALQRGYDAVSDGPVVESVEKGAANLYQVGKLYFLCGRLVVRQGLRVGERQVRRRGGVGQVAADIGHIAVDRVLHPVETMIMAWEGLVWAGGALRDISGFVKEVATGEATVAGGLGGPVPTEMH